MTTDQIMAAYDSATPEQRRSYPSLKLPRTEVLRALEKYDVYAKHYAVK